MRSEPPQSTPAYEALGTGIVLDDYKEQSSIEFPKNVALIICS